MPWELHHFLINLRIMLSHHLRREMLLHMQARRLSIDLINSWYRLHHLSQIPHEKACFAIYHDLRSGSPCKRDDGAANGHCLNHHHPKGLLPLNRVEKATRSTEQ